MECYHLTHPGMRGLVWPCVWDMYKWAMLHDLQSWTKRLYCCDWKWQTVVPQCCLITTLIWGGVSSVLALMTKIVGKIERLIKIILFLFVVMKKDLAKIRKNSNILMQAENPPERDVLFCEEVEVRCYQ